MNPEAGNPAPRWTVEQLPVEATLYSMSASPPAESNRRGEQRHLTLFRVGSIVVGGKRELCLVKNVSGGGALIRAYCELQPDMPIEIELKERQPIAAKVSWIKGSDAGLTFDTPVDVIDLLKSSGEGPRPRMPRIQVHCICFVREGAVVHRSTALNISQGGVSVESANPLTVGRDVTVTLPELQPQGAVVRWNSGDRYGLSFNNVLPLAGLIEWLHARERT